MDKLANQCIADIPIRTPTAPAQPSGLTINTTVGIGGLYDAATPSGFPKHDEDIGQTLGVWGFGEGAYLVLPGLGSNSVRDAPNLAANTVLNPLFWVAGIACCQSMPFTLSPPEQTCLTWDVFVMWRHWIRICLAERLADKTAFTRITTAIHRSPTPIRKNMRTTAAGCSKSIEGCIPGSPGLVGGCIIDAEHRIGLTGSQNHSSYYNARVSWQAESGLQTRELGRGPK